jgi:hypothetical protein
MRMTRKAPARPCGLVADGAGGTVARKKKGREVGDSGDA